jgi:hypothetical protein
MPRPWRSCGAAVVYRGKEKAQLSNQATGPPNKGEAMQTQYLIFAGAIAACGILYLLLKLESDPIDKEIEEAQRYEDKQKRIKKALRK